MAEPEAVNPREAMMIVAGLLEARRRRFEMKDRAVVEIGGRSSSRS